MTNVFVDCLRIDGSIRCPGDGGFSDVMVFGRHVKLRKDHPAIDVMRRLHELRSPWPSGGLRRLVVRSSATSP
jgi:hypothetical protein